MAGMSEPSEGTTSWVPAGRRPPRKRRPPLRGRIAPKPDGESPASSRRAGPAPTARSTFDWTAMATCSTMAPVAPRAGRSTGGSCAETAAARPSQRSPLSRARPDLDPRLGRPSGHRFVVGHDSLDELELRGLGPARLVEIPAKLEAHPEIRRGAQELGKPEGRARRHAAPLVDDLIDPLIGNADPSRQLSLRQAQRLEELFQEHVSRMRGLAMRGNSNHKGLIAPDVSRVSRQDRK